MRNRPASWPDVPMELAQVVQTKLLLVKRLYYAGHMGGFFLSKLSFLEWTFYVASTGRESVLWGMIE
jgi:hypothetical protein